MFRKSSLLLASLFTVILPVTLFATSETLPQNNWKFSLRSDARTFSEIGGQTFDSAGNPNNDFKAIKVTDYAAKNIESFQPLIQNHLISPDLKLLDSGSETNYFFDIAYGLTNSLSIGLSVPYRKRVVNYSQDYVDAFKNLDQLASNGFIPGVSGSDITVPPKTARGEGIGDMTAGFRYKILDGFAFQGTVKTGFLKTGKDYSEVEQKRDGFEEIVTGISGDEYTLETYYDVKFDFMRTELAGIYTIYTPGHASGLDNNFDTQKGNTVQLIANCIFPVHSTLEIGCGGYYFFGSNSKIKNSQGDWDKIPHSDVQAFVGQVQLNYNPLKFLQFWIGAEKPLYNKAVGGLYDYPGRLNVDGVLNCGINVYF